MQTQSHASPQSSSPPVSLGLVLIDLGARVGALEEMVELLCFARVVVVEVVVGRDGVLRAEPVMAGRP